MTDKRGFTLIELLAVLIILAIIATITIVSMSDTLRNSKNSLSKVQINNIEQSAKTYYLKDGMIEDVTCVNVSDLISKGYIQGKEVIDPKTRQPMTGSVKIGNENKKNSYNYSDEECKISIALPVTEENKTLGNIPQGNFELGDEYIVNVDGTNEYHFYVLSTDGDKVNLILNGNICNNGSLATETNNCPVYWVSEFDYNNGNSGEMKNLKGPITAMNYLHEGTKNWKNVQNIDIKYTDEGNQYGGITTEGNITSITMKDGTETASYENLKARLPMKSELLRTGCSESITWGSGRGSCPLWMVNGLEKTSYYTSEKKQNIEGVVGYWSLSGYLYEDLDNYAFEISSSGEISKAEFMGVSDMSGIAGVRPVITILKSELQ